MDHRVQSATLRSFRGRYRTVWPSFRVALVLAALGTLCTEGSRRPHEDHRHSKAPITQAWSRFCHHSRHSCPWLPLKAYLITLPGDEGKLDFSLQQLGALGLDVEIVEGVESTQAGNATEYVECLPAGDAVDCQLGLTLTHLRIWRAIAAGHEPAAWVFEDDFVLHDDFLALLPQYWAQVPLKYDYVAVGQIPRDFHPGRSTVVVAPEAMPWGTHAYVVSAQMAERMTQTAELMIRRSRLTADDKHASVWQLDGEDIKIDHFLSLMYARLTPTAQRQRWAYFESTPEVPFVYRNVTWARHGGCECSCADLDACVQSGTAPAYGGGLAAQHICRREVHRVSEWAQQLERAVQEGRAAHCRDLYGCGTFVCPPEDAPRAAEDQQPVDAPDAQAADV